VYRCAGTDAWLSVAVTGDAEWRGLCRAVPALRDMAGCGLGERRAAGPAIDAALAAWCVVRPAAEAASALQRAGVPAAAIADSVDLVASPHLQSRGFWDAHGAGVLPGLPWQASFGRVSGPAPGLGADTDAVLRDVLGLPADRIGALRQVGAFGPDRIT
jgi:crotonobetainyl-CoA:carnitine CoA-transferase CaiB-like acyl-CoA transferase